MARPPQVLSLLTRLWALSAAPSVSTNSCRFSSRSANRVWMAQSHVHRDRTSNRAPRYSDEMLDEEPGLEDLEDVEDKLQAVVNEGRKRQRTLKYHILRRKMTPPGAPQRKLTWDAIEQIRYLKQEQSEEWTVERLAEGFSVTPDVILRVLRSKFLPTPGRKAKQDAKVMTAVSQQVLPPGAGTGKDRLKLPGNHKPVTLLSGNREDALVPVPDQTLMIEQEGSGSLAKSPAPVTVVHSKFTASISEGVIVMPSTKDNITANTNPTEENKEDEDSWDGQVLTEEELEDFLEMEKPPPVVQVGKDYFDAEGKFLYRI